MRDQSKILHSLDAYGKLMMGMPGAISDRDTDQADTALSVPQFDVPKDKRTLTPSPESVAACPCSEGVKHG